MKCLQRCRWVLVAILSRQFRSLFSRRSLCILSNSKKASAQMTQIRLFTRERSPRKLKASSAVKHLIPLPTTKSTWRRTQIMYYVRSWGQNEALNFSDRNKTNSFLLAPAKGSICSSGDACVAIGLLDPIFAQKPVATQYLNAQFRRLCFVIIER